MSLLKRLRVYAFLSCRDLLFLRSLSFPRHCVHHPCQVVGSGHQCNLLAVFVTLVNALEKPLDCGRAAHVFFGLVCYLGFRKVLIHWTVPLGEY